MRHLALVAGLAVLLAGCSLGGGRSPLPVDPPGPAGAGSEEDRRRAYAAHLEFRNGKKRLAGDTARQANTGEVRELRREMRDMKELVADLALENRLLNKSMIGDGGDDA